MWYFPEWTDAGLRSELENRVKNRGNFIARFSGGLPDGDREIVAAMTEEINTVRSEIIRRERRLDRIIELLEEISGKIG